MTNPLKVSSEECGILFGQPEASEKVTDQDLMREKVEHILKQKPPMSAQEIVLEATRYTAHGDPFAPDSLKTTAKKAINH